MCISDLTELSEVVFFHASARTLPEAGKQNDVALTCIHTNEYISISLSGTVSNLAKCQLPNDSIVL
jgi:hypothetical protein